jgi:ribonuclease J
MKIVIHRGKNQIGGSIIELSTDDTKILFDIGLELDDEKNKVLPEIEGLFDSKGYDAVFISHYHSDHLGLAYEIYRDIPIYIGENSYKIIRSSDEYKAVNTISPKGYLSHGIPIVIGDINVTPYLCDHSAYLVAKSTPDKYRYLDLRRDDAFA